MTRAIAWCLAAVTFAALATANSGGYRYGVSDLAFYGAAIAEARSPSLYPRDSELLAAQTRLWVGDDLIGGVARVTGAGLPELFFAIYLVTLAALFGAAVWFARGLGFGRWTIATFLLLLSLRHQIAGTGANSLEGYMHPRMLAFAAGIAGFALVLRHRFLAALLCSIAATLIHTTTGAWFTAAIGVAAIVATRRWRLGALAAAALAGAGVWAVAAGPLSGRLVRMDATWLAVLTEKDYLFADDWPWTTWLTHLVFIAALVALYLSRRRRGVAASGEGALVMGLLALVALFVASVPFVAQRIALAVQLQINRILWLADFASAAYVAWWLSATAGRRWGARGQAAIVLALVAAAAGRGYYILRVESVRPFLQVSLPATSWADAMRWLDGQPPAWHVLADPNHAWRYGLGVRLAAFKDVVLETGKDSALAIYDREVAMRVAERLTAVGPFNDITAERVRMLDGRYQIDAVITENRALGFPVVYQNSQFVIYDLR